MEMNPRLLKSMTQQEGEHLTPAQRRKRLEFQIERAQVFREALGKPRNRSPKVKTDNIPF